MSLSSSGEVSERPKEHAWKACVRENVPWVRIPPSPNFFYNFTKIDSILAERYLLLYRDFITNLIKNFLFY
jgi:hypothetical protein